MEAPSEEQVIAGIIARDAIRLGINLCSKQVTGLQLDKTLEEFIRDNGCLPALRGYKPSFSKVPYEHTICLSRNNEAVHGVPTEVALTNDDLITIDLVVSHKGWHADTARTFTLSQDQQKIDLTKKIATIHNHSLSVITPNLPVSMYSEFCQTLAEDICGVKIIWQYCGHGIGKNIHEMPQIPCSKNTNKHVFEPGKSYAIEPVVAVDKNYRLYTTDGDPWTISTNCLSAHMEDTIFVSRAGIINLTA